jgi:Lrp/AsnC family leucine-responsive transcriptional regulator
MIDNIDRKILALLQEDARMTNAEIARHLGMAPSATLERIRRLQNTGIIREFVACIDPGSVDLGLLAYVAIKTNENRVKWDVGEMIASIPEVLEVHDIAGEDCYLVKLRTRDTESLYELLRDNFGTNEAIASTRTTIVLQTVKETIRLPLASNIDEEKSFPGASNRDISIAGYESASEGQEKNIKNEDGTQNKESASKSSSHRKKGIDR